MPIVAPPALDLAALRARCAGVVLGPDDAAYDRGRRPWNAAVEHRPAAVAVPADVRDVAEILRAAADAGAGVAVQGTGHAAATLGDLREHVLLRTDALTGVEVDAARQSARVRAGARWQDVVPAAAQAGLSPVAGSSPDVGVVGFTLGGGLGYLSRHHGLAARHVTAAELVLADGTHVRADADHDRDLLWALRGGGFGLGVVTAMEFALHPVPELYAGGLFWPLKHALVVARRWRDLTAAAPRELSSTLRFLQTPGGPVVNVQVALLGGEAQGRALLRELREVRPAVDTVAPSAADGLLRLHGDPKGPVPVITDHALLDVLPDAALYALVDEVRAEPSACVEVRHLGGALRDGGFEDGAQPGIDAEYALNVVGVLGDAAAGARPAAITAALAPWSSDRVFANFAGGPVEARRAFEVNALDRLERIRRDADPGGLFRTPLVS